MDMYCSDCMVYVCIVGSEIFAWLKFSSFVTQCDTQVFTEEVLQMWVTAKYSVMLRM